MMAAGCWLLGEAAVTFFAADTLSKWEAPVPPSIGGAPYLPGNPYLLWEMVPGERKELGVTISVNTTGLRGPEIATPKPSGVRRVIVVGDSTVYGHGVQSTQTFVRRLDGALGPNIEVINAGVPGYSSEQTLNLLTMRLWDLEPDLLIIASMWSDNNFDSFVDRELISRHQAFQSRWTTPLAQAAEHSAVYRYLDWHLRVSDREAAVREVGWMLGRAPQGDRRRVPVNDYAMNLERMVQDAADHKANVVFLSLANHVDLGAETPGARAWTLYKQVMADTALRHSAPLVDIKAAFNTSGLGRETLFLDEMHPTAQGHEIIAQMLGQAVQPWVDGARISQTAHAPVPTYEDPYSRPSLTDGPVGPGPQAQTEIVGQITTAQDTPLQIDVLATDQETGQPVQVAGERMAGPGAFTLLVPSNHPVTLRVYRDADGDGPGAGDPMISFEDQPIEASTEAPTTIQIDLDAQTMAVQ